MSPTARTISSLEALRHELSAAKGRAALVPGLPRILELVELHLVDQDKRIREIERLLSRMAPALDPSRGPIL